MLLLGFTTFFNILRHQRRFRNRAWKVRQILLRGSNFGLRFFYVPGPTALLPFRRIFTLWKIHRPRPGSNPRTSEYEASMITTGPQGPTVNNCLSDNFGQIELIQSYMQSQPPLCKAAALNVVTWLHVGGLRIWLTNSLAISNP